MSDEPITKSSKPPCNRDDALAIIVRLRKSGHVAYFAGGCVRDELLGIQPKDYDVATDAPPQRVQELFNNTQSVGVAFGVILVRHGSSVVEVATFRTDDVYLDGRRPSKVHFTTAEEDAKRRDFTINGLFLDPIENRIIDYVGGQTDLKGKVLRAIGNPSHRFEEDHLRLLRAVRFAARFDLNIEPATAGAIAAHAIRLKSISPERIAEELRLMLAPPTRNIAWRMLDEFGLTEVIFRFAPPATAMRSDPQWSIFLKLGEPPAPFGMALAAAAMSRQRDPLQLIEPAGARPVMRALRQALRISNDECNDLEDSLTGIGRVLTPSSPAMAIKKRFLARPTSALSRRLMCAIAATGIMSDRIESLDREFEQLAQTDYAPAPLLTGDDLTAAGMRPGKPFKLILESIYDAQLEGQITSKDQAMQKAMEMFRQMPPEGSLPH